MRVLCPKCSRNVHNGTVGPAGLKQHQEMGPCTPEKGTVIHFKAGNGSQLTRSAAGIFFKRSEEKIYPFWTKTYLIWKEGWIPDGLENKSTLCCF